MCGIVGLALRATAGAADRRDASPRAVQRSHRGPGCAGPLGGGRVLFGPHTPQHPRPLGARQPADAFSADGRFVLSTTARCTTSASWRREIGSTACAPRPTPKWCCGLFAKHGRRHRCAKLNGMFAFAIYDRVARQAVAGARSPRHQAAVLLVRRRQRLVFASEIKAIHALRGSRPVCDMRRCTNGCITAIRWAGTRCIAGIEQLPPGHCLELDLDSFTHTSVRTGRWRSRCKRARPSRATRHHESQKRGACSTRRCGGSSSSDVPVELFLSGGVDSSALAAFATRHHDGSLRRFRRVSISRRDGGELPKARRVAAHFGTDHHEIHIRGGDVADARRKAGSPSRHAVRRRGQHSADADGAPASAAHQGRAAGRRRRRAVRRLQPLLTLAYHAVFSRARALNARRAWVRSRLSQHRVRRYLRALAAKTPPRRWHCC